MDQNQNINSPVTSESTNNAPPFEAPQILDNSNTPKQNHLLPVFIILGALVMFVTTGAVLFFNYQYSSSAAGRMQNNYVQNQENLQLSPLQKTMQPTITPTPASAEESAIDNIQIDDASSDFSSIDQTASGL